MICFDVIVNGERLYRAGVGEAGVLSTILSWVGGATISPRKGGHRKAGETRLHVGGLYHPEPGTNAHVRWHDHLLHVGDRTVVTVVEANVADPPRRQAPRPTQPNRKRAKAARQVKGHSREPASSS